MALNFPIGHVHQLRDCAAIFRRKIDERLLPSLEVISAPELTWPKSPAVAPKRTICQYLIRSLFGE